MLNSDVAGIIEAISSIVPAIDKEAMLQSTEMGQHMVDLMNEGLKISANGWVDDDLAFVNPWGFELSEIKVPVLLYQGDEDKMVPYAHGQWLAEHLPQEKLRKHLIPGQGHISIFIGQSDGIIDELLEAARAA
jgi:pimeloyl-ACP methyl ester carboxylesterase